MTTADLERFEGLVTIELEATQEEERHEEAEDRVTKLMLDILDTIETIKASPESFEKLFHPKEIRSSFAEIQDIIAKETDPEKGKKYERILTEIRPLLGPEHITGLEFRTAGLRFMVNHLYDILEPYASFSWKDTSSEDAEKTWEELQHHLHKLVRIEMDGRGVKAANDFGGHGIGDTYIKNIGTALQRAQERIEREYPGTTVIGTRDGGDEFSITCYRASDAFSADDKKKMAEIIKNAVAPTNEYVMTQSMFDTFAERQGALALDQAIKAKKLEEFTDTIQEQLKKIEDRAREQAEADVESDDSIYKDTPENVRQLYVAILSERKKTAESSSIEEREDALIKDAPIDALSLAELTELLGALDEEYNKRVSKHTATRIEEILETPTGKVTLKKEKGKKVFLQKELTEKLLQTKRAATKKAAVHLPSFRRWRTDMSIGVLTAFEALSDKLHSSKIKDPADTQTFDSPVELLTRRLYSLAGVIHDSADKEAINQKMEQDAALKASNDALDLFLSKIKERTPAAQELAAENQRLKATVEPMKIEIDRQKSEIDALKAHLAAMERQLQDTIKKTIEHI